MTVGELISKLEKFPKNLPVSVSCMGYNSDGWMDTLYGNHIERINLGYNGKYVEIHAEEYIEDSEFEEEYNGC